MARLEFWYDLASSYSYLSAMRIEGSAAQASVEIVWRPFLLGPIFSAQGWSTSPFNLYPAKGRNMIRDMQRITNARALPFVMPQTFPAMSLAAVRIAHVGETDGWTPRFTKAAFEAEFGNGRDIADPIVLSSILSAIGLDAAVVMTAAASTSNKDSLKARTAAAEAKGIYGAPSFVTPSGELFWGDDRLDQALDWARREG